MSFRDERIEKIGDNLFEASIILSFRDGIDNKTLVGKSTMEVIGIDNRNIEITEFNKGGWFESERKYLNDEAKQAALSVFFKEVYGFTDTSSIAVDKFGRPLTDKT